MNYKSRRPNHIREYLSSADYQIYSTQCPEAALTEMRFLMFHFMEKYEEAQKEIRELIKKDNSLSNDLMKKGYFSRGGCR